MCGIGGTYAAAGTGASRGFLLHMAGDLAHRGPDGVGLYLDGRFGMVNTRLAIIDLADGDQPIGDERGRYWGMQNGEIYNYLELRIELDQARPRVPDVQRYRGSRPCVRGVGSRLPAPPQR